MPLPSSGVLTLDQIRAEFGGGYPISLSDYYRGGARVPNIALNSAVPTSGTISVSNFYGATAAAPVIPLAGGNFVHSSFGASSTVTLIVNNDGRIDIERYDNTTLVSTVSQNWFNPNVAGIGASYWRRFTRTSETLTGTGSRSTTASSGWVQISSGGFAQAFANASSGAIATARGVYTVEIASDSGGSNIVTSGSFTLEAQSNREA